MINKPLAPIARATIADQIVERITAFILDAKLRPGDKLPSERDLMVQLGVGRSSLREAIKTLSAIGIVDVQIGDGMYVSGGQTAVLTKRLAWGLLLGDHSTREVIEARRAVEVELSGLAATRLTPDDLAAIGALWATMRANDDNAESFTEADQAFHLAIAKAARNSVTLSRPRHPAPHHPHLDLQDLLGISQPPGRFRRARRDLAALEARDPDAARRAMAAHLDAAGARLLSLLGKS
ncbi:MAG: FadR/GntR family transcriptional regulator [Chloroflexia bacterium]